jgi:hypothetical protein
MQVVDPSIVHGPLRRQQIGTDDLVVAVGHFTAFIRDPSADIGTTFTRGNHEFLCSLS